MHTNHFKRFCVHGNSGSKISLCPNPRPLSHDWNQQHSSDIFCSCSTSCQYPHRDIQACSNNSHAQLYTHRRKSHVHLWRLHNSLSKWGDRCYDLNPLLPKRPQSFVFSENELGVWISLQAAWSDWGHKAQFSRALWRSNETQMKTHWATTTKKWTAGMWFSHPYSWLLH